MALHKLKVIIKWCSTVGLYSIRAGWKVHRLTMMQWLNLTKCGLFFNIVSPAVHTLPPPELQRLDSCGKEAPILIFKKVLNYMTSSSIWYCFPSKCLFMLGNRKIVRWCQIRWLWRVINQFKARGGGGGGHSNYFLTGVCLTKPWNGGLKSWLQAQNKGSLELHKLWNRSLGGLRSGLKPQKYMDFGATKDLRKPSILDLGL